MIKFKLENGAKLPKKGSPGAAGYDIHSLKDVWIEAGSRVLVKTGVFLADCPSDVYLRVAPRSKLANKYGIDVLAGVIDSDYRGEICVILFSTNKQGLKLGSGGAIAQLIPTQLANVSIAEVNTLTDTTRGTNGINCDDLRL